MKKYIWGIFYGILLTAFTVYVMLDTFVITRVYTVVPPDEEGSSSIVSDGKNNENNLSETALPETTITRTDTYSDGNISITLTEYREHDTTIYVADVQVSSAEYLKTAFAKNAYGKNITDKTSEIAEDAGAILAINGDYYGAREKGYVIRNGVLYRSASSSSQEDAPSKEDTASEAQTSKRNTVSVSVGTLSGVQVKNCGERGRTMNFLSWDRNVIRKTKFYERRDVYDCSNRRNRTQQRKEKRYAKRRT